MAKTINFPDKAKKRISASIPEELIKQRKGGGGKSLSYISGATVDDILNDSFNYNWDWEIINSWIQQGYTYTDKNGNEFPQGPIAHVHGRLTVKFLDDDNNLICIKKDGFGSKTVLGKQNDQDSIFKAADTDAMKKAASRLGIGLDLYRDEEEQVFFDNINYENPWTEDAIEKYSDYIEQIDKIKTTYELEDDDLNEFVQEFSENNLYSLQDITPEYIIAFCEFLNNKINQSNEEQ